MIAIIPARGGSKGLPGKNIKLLHGKPLINYTIDAAINAECIDRIVVTTDDKDIANISMKAGADVPFMRPKELASDYASAIDVYIHAVEYLAKDTDRKVDEFMVLLPTAPLRTAQHIEEAYNLYKKTSADTLISVSEAETPPGWYMDMTSEGYISNAGLDTVKSIMSNRQFNSRYYIPNGAIYILKYDILRCQRTYYTDRTIGYVMDRRHSVDIDNQDDFDYAEYLIGQNYV